MCTYVCMAFVSTDERVYMCVYVHPPGISSGTTTVCSVPHSRAGYTQVCVYICVHAFVSTDELVYTCTPPSISLGTTAVFSVPHSRAGPSHAQWEACHSSLTTGDSLFLGHRGHSVVHRKLDRGVPSLPSGERDLGRISLKVLGAPGLEGHRGDNCLVMSGETQRQTARSKLQGPSCAQSLHPMNCPYT